MERGGSERGVPLRFGGKRWGWEMPPGRSAGRNQMLHSRLKLAVERGGQAVSRGSHQRKQYTEKCWSELMGRNRRKSEVWEVEGRGHLSRAE